MSIFKRRLKIKYRDDEISEVSQLFFADEEEPTFGRKHLEVKKLDYSIESLLVVDKYLDSVRKQSDVESYWNQIVLRCGTYVGEVVRRNCKKRELHWIDYETALLLDEKSFANFQLDISTAVMLYGNENFFCFPLAKVHKYLENGAEDSVHSFAQVLITM